MNWLAFAFIAWIFLGLEMGLKKLLAIGPYHIAPSFLFVLVSLVAMSAPARPAIWAALALGLLADLTRDVPRVDSGQNGVVIGPAALAFLLGAQLILSLRGVMIRRNPLTLGFLAMVGSAVGAIVIVAIFFLRRSYDPIIWQPVHELWTRLLGAAYTGGLGSLLALVLIPLTPFLGLPSPQQRRFAR